MLLCCLPVFSVWHVVIFCFEGSGAHRDLHVLTHSFPTRRSSDLHDRGRRSRARRGARGGGAAWYMGASRLARAPARRRAARQSRLRDRRSRSEEHTSELQSLMRISYAVFCLKKKNTTYTEQNYKTIHYTYNTKLPTPIQST